MERKLFSILAIAALFSMLPLSKAFSYSITTFPDNDTANAYPIFYDFESGAASGDFTDGDFFVNSKLTNIPGISAPPANMSDGNDYYLSIPDRDATFPAFAELTLPASPDGYNYLGLYWGSVDGNVDPINFTNYIDFFLGTTPVATFSGTNLPPASGDQSTATYVNIFGLPKFDRVHFVTEGYAFELDEIAVANVPIPAAVWLLGSGLFGLALIRRRK